jgi:hypothetical protein
MSTIARPLLKALPCTPKAKESFQTWICSRWIVFSVACYKLCLFCGDLYFVWPATSCGYASQVENLMDNIDWHYFVCSALAYAWLAN